MIGVILVGLSVGLSNFAASIGIGLSGVDARKRLQIGLAFGLFETGMPIVGLLIGKALAGPAAGAGRYVGAGLLVVTGAYVLWKGRKDEELVEPEAARMGFGQLLITAFALSLDNLVIGFALSFYTVPLLLAAAVIGAISVTMSLLGLQLGTILGKKFERWSEELGGGVLILVGAALGFGLLG